MYPPNRMMMVESSRQKGSETADVGHSSSSAELTATMPPRKQSVFGNAPRIVGGETSGSSSSLHQIPVIFRNGRRSTGGLQTHRRSLHSNSSECHSVSSAESQGSLLSVDEADELLEPCNGDTETISSDGDHLHRRDSDATGSSEGGLDELEELVLTAQTHLSSFKSCRDQLETFELSYKDSKRMVREMAQELVMKIREHEARLLDEIETKKETTQKQFQWKKDKIDTQIKSLEKICEEGTQAVRESIKYEDTGMVYDQAPIVDKLKSTLRAKDMHMNNMDLRMGPIYINPVRCNTAYATLDRSGEAPSPMNFQNSGVHRRKSVNVNMMRSPLSQTGRNRTGSLQVVPSFGSQSQLGKGDISRRFSLQPAHQSRGAMSPGIHRLKSPCLSEDCSQTIRLLWEITTEGPEPGQVNCPNDILILTNGDIVVSDRDNHRLQIFSQQGRVKSIISDVKLNPRRITAMKDGNIAITDSKDNLVKIYDTSGNLVGTWGKKRFKAQFKSPCAIAAAGHKPQLIVSDMEKHSVTIHNTDGKLVKQMGSDVEFHSPSYITVNDKNKILVSDNWNHCVKVFDENGHYLFQFEEMEDKDNNLRYPNGISTDGEGNIYVADWGSHCVSIFNQEGKFVERLLTKQEHGIYHPAGLAVRGSILALSEYSDHHSAVRVYCMEVNI